MKKICLDNPLMPSQTSTLKVQDLYLVKEISIENCVLLLKQYEQNRIFYSGGKKKTKLNSFQQPA